MKPELGRRKRAVSVHVRINNSWHPAQSIKVVLKIHLRQHNSHHEVQDHHKVAKIFVIDNGVYQHRDHAEDPEPDQLAAKEIGQVQAQLEMVIAVEDLNQ